MTNRGRKRKQIESPARASVNGLQDKQSRVLKELLHRKGGLRHGLARVRAQASPQQVRSFVHDLIRAPVYLENLAVGAFPRSFRAMKPGPTLQQVGVATELAWSASVLLAFAPQIRDFLCLEERFYDLYLAGDHKGCMELLNFVEAKFGYSLWFFRSKLAVLQALGGLEAQNAFLEELFRDREGSNIVTSIVYFFSLRVEENVSAEKYREMIDRTLSRPLITSKATQYYRFYLTPEDEIDPESIPNILSADENSPILDRYLTFISSCQTLLASEATPGEIVTQMACDLANLAGQIPDRRLRSLHYASVGSGGIALIDERATDTMRMLDLYTSGNYPEARLLCETILQQHAGRVDLYELYVKSCARSGYRLIPQEPLSPFFRTVFCMTSLYTKEAAVDEAAAILLKIAASDVCRSLSQVIRSFIDRKHVYESAAELSTADILCTLNSPRWNPWHHRTFQRLRPGADLLAIARQAFPHSITLRLQNAIDRPVAEAAAEIDSADMPRERKMMYTALVLSKVGDLESAADLLSQCVNSDLDPGRFQAMKQLFLCQFRLGNFNQLLDLIVDAYFANKQSFSIFSLPQLLDHIEQHALDSCYDNVSLSIVYDIYSKHISLNKEGEKADAYEEFLLSRGVNRPSDLRGIGTDLSSEKLVYFLQQICVPRVMDQSLYMDNTRDVENERIAVCQLLSELDWSNQPVYAEEIRDLTRRRVVRDRLRQVEQSKIYVDVASVKKKAEKSLRESFGRYLNLLSNPEFDTQAHEIFKKIRDIIGEASVGIQVMDFPSNQRDQLFEGMIYDLFAMLVSNREHGLETYLSTRIRHGTLSGQLRSPLEVQHLVTQKDGTTGIYIENKYWPARLHVVNQSVLHLLSSRLDNFSKEMDDLIGMLTRDWIQVRSEERPNGLFDFRIGNYNTYILQSEMNIDTTYEHFVDGVIAFFWSRVEHTLENIREKIGTDFRASVTAAFDRLQNDIEQILADERTGEITDAITAARTAIQVTIDNVVRWFQLAKASERPDYTLDIAIDAAVQSINSCYRSSQISPDLKIAVPRAFRGGTLDSVIDILFILFENMVKHCGSTVGSPKSSVTASLDRDTLRLTLTNEVAPVSDVEAENERLTRKKASYGAEAAGQLVAREGGSGYPKILKIATHDLNCRPEIRFRFMNKSAFEVVLDLSTEGLFL